MFALQIERVYTKEQIPDDVLQPASSWAAGRMGFEAAANYYFRKPLKDLGLHQYALLAAPAQRRRSSTRRCCAQRRRSSGGTLCCRRWLRPASSPAAEARRRPGKAARS
jgi:membrane peptidoglycan carboxypeptidase